MKRRPLAVTIIAIIFLVTGLIGFGYHLSEVRTRPGFDDVWILLTETLAVVAGVFLWRRQNWARWLAILWMGFHVGISYFDPFPKMAVHAILLALIAYFLFRPAAAEYFA